MMATAIPASADLAIPLLSYRTGPYAPNGIPYADGVEDYISMINARDGGVGGESNTSSKAGGAAGVGGAVTVSAISDGFTTLSVSSGDGGAGGAIISAQVVGATTAAVTLTGGAGAAGIANDAPASGGPGGAIIASTFTGAITGSLTLAGGAGAAGGGGGAKGLNWAPLPAAGIGILKCWRVNYLTSIQTREVRYIPRLLSPL